MTLFHISRPSRHRVRLTAARAAGRSFLRTYVLVCLCVCVCTSKTVENVRRLTYTDCSFEYVSVIDLRADGTDCNNIAYCILCGGGAVLQTVRGRRGVARRAAKGPAAVSVIWRTYTAV